MFYENFSGCLWKKKGLKPENGLVYSNNIFKVFITCSVILFLGAVMQFTSSAFNEF